ncbi:MAG: MauE/DoxX family redox-associated membrane protein, partial [Aquabacterium sp.]
MTALDPLLVWMAAAALAVLLAHAAISKLADRDLLAQHLAAYRLPAALLAPAAWLLPLAEATTALALLSPGRAAGAVAAACLLLAYGAAMAWHRAHGRRLDCGCGGEPLPLSWALVLRNALLAALAVPAAAPLGPRALGVADVAVIAAGLVLGALLMAAVHQVLRHQARLAGPGLFGHR